MRILTGLLVLLLCVGAASAALAGLDRIELISGQWVTTRIASGFYRALTHDVTLTSVVYGARVDGGLDRIRLYGGSWTVDQISPHPYVSITRDASQSRCIYGARAGGGLDRIIWNTTALRWDVEPLNPHAYVSVTRDATLSEVVYGARAEGGLDRIRYASGWITESLNDRSYSTIINASSPSQVIFGAKVGGGLDRIYYSGSAFTTQTINSISYSSLAAEPSKESMIYGARTAGGLDRIFYGMIWTTQPISTQSYYALTRDASGSYSTYAASQSAGLDRVYWLGSGSWLTQDMNAQQYCALTSDCQANVLYGATPMPGTFPINDIRDTKAGSDGIEVWVTATVTAVFQQEDGAGGYVPIGFAIENADRSAGIRVVSDAADIRPGSSVSVHGTTATVSGERVIQADSVVVNSTGGFVPPPYLATTRDLCGGALGAQGAVVDNALASPTPMASGANNVGFLMTIRGRVTAVVRANPAATGFEDCFYVDDAYGEIGIRDGSGHAGVRCRPCFDNTGALSLPSVGDRVEVTGVAGVRQINGINTRYIWTAYVAPATTDTFTLDISQGWNLISFPAAPVDPDPRAIFSGYDLDGNLYSWDATTRSLVQLDILMPEAFGPITATNGYWLNAGSAGSISYTGYVDAGPALDRWISVQSDWNLIGMPHTTATTWGNWHAIGGTDILTLFNASEHGEGWMQSLGYWWNTTTQSLAKFGLPADGVPTQALSTGSGYRIKSNRILGLITPVSKWRTFIVDSGHPDASDLNGGTEWAPLSTINAAVSRMAAGDTIYVKNGTYREFVRLPQGKSGAPVSLRAWPGHSPVIKGSDVVTGSWTRLSESSNIYWTSWTTYTQMCFVDGQRYKQIGPFQYMSPAAFAPNQDGDGVEDMRPATFFYDNAAKRIYVWMTNGDDPGNGHTVELATRYMGIRFEYFTNIDGITVMHCQASPSADYCAIGGNGAWNVVENCKTLQNDHVGIWVQGRDSIVRNCEMAFNGNGGFRSSTSERIQLIENFWHDNSWRGYKPGWEDSTKVHGWTDCAFIRNRSKNDLCGIWVDVGSRNILIADNLIEDTPSGIGIYYEISRWGVIVNNILRNCYAGINSYSSDVLVSNNVFEQCYVGGGVYSTMRQEPVAGYPPYYPGAMCLVAMRNNMWVNNVMVRKGPYWYDWSALQVNAHAGNNLLPTAYPAESRGINLILGTASNPNVNPFQKSSAEQGGYWATKLGAAYDYRLLEGHLGGGKAIPATLTSVYYGSSTPLWQGTICDASHPDCVYQINGTCHYRAQPLPEFLDICDISNQPVGDRGINFTWQSTGNYPKIR